MPTTGYRIRTCIVDENGNLVTVLPQTVVSQISDFASGVRAQIAPYRATSTAAATANPVLEDGRLGIETDTKNVKIGDGTTTWNNLPYAINHNTAVTFEISS